MAHAEVGGSASLFMSVPAVPRLERGCRQKIPHLICVLGQGLELKESLWAGLSKARVCWHRLHTFLLLLSELLPASPLYPRVNSKPADPKCCPGEINHLCLCCLSAGEGMIKWPGKSVLQERLGMRVGK